MNARSRSYRRAEHSERDAEDRGISPEVASLTGGAPGSKTPAGRLPDSGAAEGGRAEVALSGGDAPSNGDTSESGALGGEAALHRRAQVAALQAAIARMGGARISTGAASFEDRGTSGAALGDRGTSGALGDGGTSGAALGDRGTSAALAWSLADSVDREVEERTQPDAAMERAWQAWLGLVDLPGRVISVQAPPGAGALPLVLQLLARAARGGMVAWVEASGSFHPPTAAAHGVALERLLVVRASRSASLLRATELLLASSALELIVVAVPAEVVAEGLRARLRRLAVRARQERTGVLWWTGLSAGSVAAADSVAASGTSGTSSTSSATLLPGPVDASLCMECPSLTLRGVGALHLRGRPQAQRLGLPLRVPSSATELYRPLQRLCVEGALARRPRPRTQGARVRG